MPTGSGQVHEEPTTTAALARRGVTACASPGADHVALDVVADAPVSTDPRRVERILVNLLANALVHGAGAVRVVVHGTRISFHDKGSGFSEELLSAGPRRFRTGATERNGGHGLGLTIALGQARVIGANLTLANDEEGAVATLDLAFGLAGERDRS